MDKPTFYQIRVKGHLDAAWAEWFEGLTISNQEDGDAILSGYLQDQSALQGIFNRITNLGLTLISVNPILGEDRIEGEITIDTNSTFLERYSLPLFLILTPLISLAIPYFLSLPKEVVPLMLVFIPAMLALFFTAFAEGGKGVGALLKKLTQWRIGFKWYIITLGLAAGLRLTMSVLAFLFGWIPVIRFNDWTPQQYVIIGIFILIGAFMEELGWRGYVLPKLLAHRSALSTALLIGIPWGILHLGLTFPGQMNAGTSWLETILYLIALSIVLTWLFVQTQGNLVVVILYHGAENFFVFLNGGISITQSLRLLNVVTIMLAAVLVLFYGVDLQRNSEKKEPLVDEGQASE